MARNKEKETQDKNGEKLIHEFLEKYFYVNLSDYQYCDDKETQIKGIDTIFTFRKNKYKCDEKVALDYVNGCKGYKLQTFCLELSFLDRGNNLQEGWLTKDDKENDSYLFVWLDRADKNVITSVEDIKEIEMALVKKQDILDYLASKGWDKKKLRKKAKQIRFDNDKAFGNHKENGCKFSFSPTLSEKPVNILLTRYVYKSLPNTFSKKIIINEASN